MGGLLILVLLVGALGLLDVLAIRHGVDSTPSSVDPRRPAKPVGLSV